MLKRKLSYGLAVFLLAAFIALPVNAATLTIEDEYIGYGHISYYDKINDQNVGINPRFFNVDKDKHKGIITGAGLFQISDYDGKGSSWGFCVDLGTLVGFGQNDFDETAGLTIPNQDYVEWMLDSYADDALKYSTNGAALQLAIWEVIYDDGALWNFDAGKKDLYRNGESDDTTFEKYQNFYYGRTAAKNVDANLNAWYDSYMIGLTAAIEADVFADGYEGNYIIAGLSQDGKPTQDLIVNVVPEPTTLLLFGFGLLGMGAISRKKQF